MKITIDLLNLFSNHSLKLIAQIKKKKNLPSSSLDFWMWVLCRIAVSKEYSSFFPPRPIYRLVSSGTADCR